jgi:hypothetical protein
VRGYNNTGAWLCTICVAYSAQRDHRWRTDSSRCPASRSTTRRSSARCLRCPSRAMRRAMVHRGKVLSVSIACRPSTSSRFSNISFLCVYIASSDVLPY